MLSEPKEARINLRRLREGREWSQEDLAMRVGVTRAHISCIESGRRKITLKMMRKFMVLFDLKLEDFFMHDGD